MYVKNREATDAIVPVIQAKTTQKEHSEAKKWVNTAKKEFRNGFMFVEADCIDLKPMMLFLKGNPEYEFTKFRTSDLAKMARFQTSPPKFQIFPQKFSDFRY